MGKLKLKFEGKIYSLKELAEKTNLNYDQLRARVDRNKKLPKSKQKSMEELTINFSPLHAVPNVQDVLIFADRTYVTYKEFRLGGGNLAEWHRAVKMIKKCPDMPRERAFKASKGMSVIDGQYLSFRAVSELYGVSLTTLSCRLIAHPDKTTKQLMEKPPTCTGWQKGKVAVKINYRGKIYKPHELAKVVGCNVNTIYTKIRNADKIDNIVDYSKLKADTLTGVCKIRVIDLEEKGEF